MRALNLFVGLLLFASGALAALPKQGDIAEIADKPRWQALVHLNTGATLRGSGNSYADDPDFFLAENGKRDPVAELRATWHALRPPDSQARCRFPARYRFLAESLDWTESEPLAHCSDYNAWREKMPIGQLVLVFPAAYLNSPSSMFGHTLLRLDAERNPDSVWLSHAINFGAQVDDQENSILYIWRGLAGGYPGQFSVVPYVEKIREYAHLENRDMWEYALNLSRDELDWLVRHLWELRDINFDYYFFDENCSFRLLELIRTARPQAPLLEEFRFAELPVNTVRSLYEADLVSERRYRPSKAKELAHLVDQLDSEELALAERLMEAPDIADSQHFRSYPEVRRHLMANVAYQALRLRYRDEERTAAVAERSLALLRVVQRVSAPDLPPLPAPAAPELGHDTEAATVGTGRRDGRAFLELGYRLTYHDTLDPVTGFLRGAGIEGMDINLRLTESKGLELERLDLVRIRSLAPRKTFVKPISWFVHGGLEQAHTGQRRRSALFLQGGPGMSWELNGLQPYAFAAGRLENVSGAEPSLAAGTGMELGVLYYAQDAQFGFQSRRLYFENEFYRHRTSFTANMPVSRNNATRFECAYVDWKGGDETECRIFLRHFFD